MPCYDPPPPWAGREQASAEAAVRLLCALTQEAIARNVHVSREVLQWFIGHRIIDLEAATASHPMRSDADPAAIVRSITAAQELLERLHG